MKTIQNTTSQKTIQNTTSQSFAIPFTTPKGIIDFYLRAKNSITVPNSYTSIVLDNLVKRNLVKIKITSK